MKLKKKTGEARTRGECGPLTFKEHLKEEASERRRKDVRKSRDNCCLSQPSNTPL